MSGDRAAERRLVERLRARADADRELSALVDWRFGCIEQLVMDLGRWFEPPPQTVLLDEDGYSAWTQWVARIPDLLYVEGWLLDDQDHARYAGWCAHADGSLALAPPACAYLGVPLHERFHWHGVGCVSRLGRRWPHLDRVRILRIGLPWWAVPTMNPHTKGASRTDDTASLSQRPAAPNITTAGLTL